MELFLKQGAPAPQDMQLWVHFGSSNACYAWTKGPEGLARSGQVEAARYLILSRTAVPLAGETLAAYC